MWPYVGVFLTSFAVDVIPLIGPPAWICMVFFLTQYDLNPWLVLCCGVPGSTLGRFVLSAYMPLLSNRLIKRRKNEELQYLGRKLGQKLWRTWTFVLIYSLLPLSTTALFSAAGVARIRPVQILPPFFVGKFASDALMVFTGHYAATNLADIVHGTFSWKGIVTAVLGLAIIAGLLFIDWRVLLQKKKVALNFQVWK